MRKHVEKKPGHLTPKKARLRRWDDNRRGGVTVPVRSKGYDPMRNIRETGECGGRKSSESEARAVTIETKSKQTQEPTIEEFEWRKIRLYQALDAFKSQVAKAKRLAH